MIQPSIDPAESLATDEHHRRSLASSVDRSRGLLRIFALPGDLVSLGRFHLVPADTSPTVVQRLHRRHSGGRNLPFGDGFIALSLVLPHRSALVADEPLTLNPSQVLNRCVRGILEGLKSLGVPAFYPGRDYFTVDGRVVGMVSIDIGPEGGLLFDAVIAGSRDFSVTVAPPNSEMAGRMAQFGADDVTSLKRELGIDLAVEDASEFLVRGYEEQFGISFTQADEEPAVRREIDRLAADAFSHEQWVLGRQVRWTPDYHATVEALLGRFETHVSLAPNGDLDEVLLAGDLIAHAGALTALEAKLRGCRPETAAIEETVEQIFSVPENFVLGLPKTSVISTTIMTGLSKRLDSGRDSP